MPKPKLYDVSLPLHPGMAQWPGEQILDEAPLSRTPRDIANVTRLALTTHSGTHVDPPRHFVHNGATVDELPLERWVGPCYVADCRAATPEIEPRDLEAAGVPPGTERLIIRTTNSDLWTTRPDSFADRYVGLSHAGAAWLVARGVRLVGIDYLSIGPFHTTNAETHVELLGNDIIIIEGLDLRAIESGVYELLCLPLKIRGGDGAPARVALRGPLESRSPARGKGTGARD